MALNDDILNEIIGHKVDLLRFSESVRKKIVALLTSLGSDIQKQIYDADLAGITRTDFKQRRQEKLINQTQGTIDSTYGDTEKLLDSQLLSVSKSTNTFSRTLLEDSFQKGVSAVTLTPNDLKELVSNSLIEGAPTADWWSKQSADLQGRFAQQVRLGVAAGETNDDIVKRIRGKATGSSTVVDLGNGETKLVKDYAGGVMDISAKDAAALVRSSVQTISNNVLEATYKENDDVLKGLVAIATLDLRTTIFCRAADGSAWDFEGNILPQSKTKMVWRGPPPWHWGCRTVVAPITKSWEELAKEAGNTVSIKEVPPSVRASMDGEVPAALTYEQWLKTQSVARQKEVLKDAKWQMWNDGKLTFQEMVDQTGNPLTLDQLEARVKGSTAVKTLADAAQEEEKGIVLPKPLERGLEGVEQTKEEAISKLLDTFRVTPAQVADATIPDSNLFPKAVMSVTRTADMAGAFVRAVSMVSEDEDTGAIASRILYRNKDDARLIVENEALRLVDAPARSGSTFFYSQVQHAKEMGADAMIATAERSEISNGYYTLPRLGYDGNIPSRLIKKFPKQFSGFTKLSELMDTAEGRAWWKQNGDTVPLVFDLSLGSQSMQRLDAYMLDRAKVK